MDIVPGDLDNQNVEESSDVNPPPNLRPTTGESQTDTPESTQPLSITPHPQNPSTDAPARSRTPSSRLEGNGMRSDSPPPPANDNDSDGDSSLDDEDEHPYWANFQQDTSTASGDELAAIEARTTDISATDGTLFFSRDSLCSVLMVSRKPLERRIFRRPRGSRTHCRCRRQNPLASR